MIDEKTIYLRMPPSFMEPETLLMVLKNLMRKAYDREQEGTPAPEQKPDPKPEPKAAAAIPVAAATANAPAGPAARSGATCA